MASKLKIALGAVGGLVGVTALAAGGGWFWAKATAGAYLDKSFETHHVDFPIPFPLTGAEIEALRAERATQAAVAPVEGATLVAIDAANPATVVPAPDPLEGVDLDAIALERAAARGKHLVESRYVCIECHGPNFGGGTMIDDPMIGTLKGKNLTTGHGSVTTAFTPADWDRAVRHGVNHEGKPLVMPSGDFFMMSDRELSDIVTYIRTLPAVEGEVPDPKLGPLGTVLCAAGEITVSAYEHPDHMAAHAVEPPEEAVTVEFGKHLSGVCTGCHRTDFSGGKMAGGDPSWPPVANITPHADGLAGWTYADFEKVMRTGVRKSGQTVVLPMSIVVPYSSRMTDTELQALWAYLQTVEPKPDNG